MLIVRSPLRISFAGGGTDLPSYFETYGGAVLSAAINKYFYTIVGKRTDGRIQIISSDLKVFETWSDINQISLKESGSALEIPLAVVKDLGRQIAVDLFLSSEIPPGTGLGSSASVCVNVLQALAGCLNLSLSKHELAERAFHIARNVLGKSVGKQDEFAAAFGGLNFLVFNTDGSTRVEPVNLRPEIMNGLQRKLMLFFTGTARDSWAILKEQEELTRRRGGAAVESLHRLRELATRMRCALEEGALHEFGLLLHDGWENKKRISERISSVEIDRLYSLARKSGAVGGKITGAGGGGFMLLYCEEENQSAVQKAFAGEGVQEMKFAFDFAGSRVLVNDPFIDQAENCAAQFSAVSVGRQAAWSRKQI
jgi:D-glycero-alpha-D-manno-heptose-7-phosphate kinase